MGRSVPVKIGQTEFASKQKARSYYMDQRPDVKAVGVISEGGYLEELKELFTLYCELTKWDLSNRDIYAFSVDYEPRHTGQTYGAYLCYWVQFSPKDRLSFSLPDGVTGTEFQTKDLDCECEFYEISSEGRLLRWMDDGTRTDICFDGLLTLSAGDGYHLYFEQGALAWIEVYSQSDKRWPFDPARVMADHG